MATNDNEYPVKFNIDYPNNLDRATTFFRLILSIPILIILSVLTSSDSTIFTNEAGKIVISNGSGIAGGLFMVTLLMILFRQRYPKWWFDFNLELNRFSSRVGAYLFLLTDKYPSTEDHQSVHLDIKYPDAKNDLARWMPLVKWLLAIPHYFVLCVLAFGAFFVTIIAWFAILFTGKYPQSLFEYVVGVGRWGMRVAAYAFLLTTDKYPPFSLK